MGGTPGFTGLAVDGDQDGYSNGYEMAFGGNPDSAGSQPPMPMTTRDAGNGNVTVAWASQTGRLYTVYYRDDLTLGTWQILGSVTASGTSTTFTDTTASSVSQRFYRVGTLFQ